MPTGSPLKADIDRFAIRFLSVSGGIANCLNRLFSQLTALGYNHLIIHRIDKAISVAGLPPWVAVASSQGGILGIPTGWFAG
jgi:hypothetical protein